MGRKPGKNCFPADVKRYIRRRAVTDSDAEIAAAKGYSEAAIRQIRKAMGLLTPLERMLIDEPAGKQEAEQLQEYRQQARDAIAAEHVAHLQASGRCTVCDGRGELEAPAGMPEILAEWEKNLGHLQCPACRGSGQRVHRTAKHQEAPA